MNPTDEWIDVGFQMHVRRWQPVGTAKRPFLLVHGLASNARTWDGVGQRLAAAGHPAIAIDQRGHGRSDKLDDGYDFDTITQDLHTLLAKLGWERPILAGQSWGGNVLLAFGARFPGVAQRLVFVDGGFLDLKRRGSWETVAAALRPPALNGAPRTEIAARIKQFHPHWLDAGIEATLHNFETLPDGTVRPWLTLDRHMRILRAMYDQDVAALYPQVQEPVLICAADDGTDWAARKRPLVETAVAHIPHATALWFENSAHDIHVDQPDALTEAFLQAAG